MEKWKRKENTRKETETNAMKSSAGMNHLNPNQDLAPPSPPPPLHRIEQSFQLYKKRAMTQWFYEAHYTWGEGGLKTRQMFSSHTAAGEFKKVTITGDFRFVFEENTDREITLLS